MADSRTGRASSLVEVAWVLVQQGRQYGAADHDVRETVGGSRAKSFSISPPALAVLRSIRGLPGGRNQGDAGSGDRISGNLEGELEFHLRGEWRRITLIRNVEVWNDSENALPLLGLELLGGNFYRIVMNVNRCLLRLNPELDASNNFELSWIYGDGGRCPVREILCTDLDFVRSGRLYVSKFEKPAFGGDEGAAIVAFRSLQNNRRIGNRITVHIGNGSD